MFSKRQNQVSNFLKEELGTIFLEVSKQWFPGKMLTVSIVRITKDLSIADVFISVFPSDNAENDVKTLNDNVSKIRYELGKSIRHNIKKIPELRFHLDDSLDYIDKINDALK